MIELSGLHRNVFWHVFTSDFCGDSCTPYNENYLAWEYPGIGRNICFNAIQCLVFFAVVLSLEYQLPQKLTYLMRRGVQGMQGAPVVDGENDRYNAVSSYCST